METLALRGECPRSGVCFCSRISAGRPVLCLPAKSRELLKCAVKSDPRHSPSWQTWMELESRLGNQARADELRQFMMEEQTDVMPGAPPVPEDLTRPAASVWSSGGNLGKGFVNRLRDWLFSDEPYVPERRKGKGSSSDERFDYL